MALANNWSVLNIGSANDPVGLSSICDVTHFDIDYWPHEKFVQGDAHCVAEIVGERSYDLVIMGDVHEHLVDPKRATAQAMLVARKYLVMTIFQEWRLPGVGQWIKEGAALSDEHSRAIGYVDRLDYQAKVYPERVGYDDTRLSHLSHINQFTDEMVADIILAGLEARPGSRLEAFHKAAEHEWWHWLIAICVS